MSIISVAKLRGHDLALDYSRYVRVWPGAGCAMTPRRTFDDS